MSCMAVSFSAEDVLTALEGGEIIADYPDDQPYPSMLVLGRRHNRPIHVVAALTPEAACIVVTAYVPSREHWSADFKIRRRE